MIEPETIIRFKQEDTPDISELKKPRKPRKKKLQTWPFDWLPFGCEE